jgi:hypothetical protein
MPPQSGDRNQADLQSAPSEIVEEAASVVDDAAKVDEPAKAAVQEATAVAQETAPAINWPDVERRRKPRLLRRLHEEGKVQWKHIAVYVPVLLLVVVLGAYAIWLFLEKQFLLIRPSSLPKVTIVTADLRSPVNAGWVRLLTDAGMQPTLVPLDKVEVLQGVVALCNVPTIPPGLANDLAGFADRGGAIAVFGQPPSTSILPVTLSADSGISDTSAKFSEAVSPLLARLTPGHQFWVKPSHVAFLKESPRMVIDARWRTNARAVIMHMEKDGSRYVWFGFDPNALVDEDRQLMLLLRTAFRWAAGQPVSDGAVGAPQVAKAFTPEARMQAREGGFAYSVDPLPNPGQFSVRMRNRGQHALQNPTVKIWLPSWVTRVALGGDILMKRNVTLIGVPEEGACLISRPQLVSGEERVMKLTTVSARRSAGRP